ncbi:hypothetical protein [Streptomyces sp. MMG1533]|uniref:hypothetical protein n=1 Tax=Streptomyces sp. MMG1533 TaxID=1415546 RepID=UPI000A7E7565|nr:hypothetical protein [Streptomyces sp. MMG1533]
MSPPGGGQLRTFRSKPKSGWTPTSNQHVARNYVLSLKAKGLLVTFLSQPDGSGMTVERLAYLHKAAGGKGEGEHAIREALKELRAAGLVTHAKEKGKGGRWQTTTLVSDTPEGLLLLLKQISPDP